MTWVRIDDHFDEHPKLAAVGPVGWGVWLAGLAYCNRNLTDGFIPYSVAEGIGGNWRIRLPAPEGDSDDREQIWDIARGSGMHGEDMDTGWVIDLLVFYGLWERCHGGYRIHDYQDYQPTKAAVMEQREKKAAAGRAGGLARHQAPAKAPAKQVPSSRLSEPEAKAKPIPIPKPVPEVLLEVHGATDALEYVDPMTFYQERCKRRSLSQKERDWIEDLHARFSRSELVRALEAVPPGTDYLKRVDSYLEGAA